MAILCLRGSILSILIVIIHMKWYPLLMWTFVHVGRSQFGIFYIGMSVILRKLLEILHLNFELKLKMTRGNIVGKVWNKFDNGDKSLHMEPSHSVEGKISTLRLLIHQLIHRSIMLIRGLNIREIIKHCFKVVI